MCWNCNRIHEAPHNVALRREYLYSYVEYAAEGRPFVYMDETWMNNHHTTKGFWSDNSNELHGQVSSVKGQRYIIIGAVSEKGFIDDSFDLWTGKQKDGDYHTEMNGELHILN